MSKRSVKIPAVARLRVRARATGVPVSELCRRAKISYSTWKRWVSGEVAPRTDTFARMDSVVMRAELNLQRRTGAKGKR